MLAGLRRVCRSLMETNGFPLFSLGLAGSRTGSRPTFLRRQESGQRRRPRIRRPAQNSPAARAQTTAPEGPARCCAARRFRRGFSESPSVAARAGV